MSATTAGRRLRLSNPRLDDDPLPRAARVVTGSAFAAVSEAAMTVPEQLRTGAPIDLPGRRRRLLRSWQFVATPGTSLPAAPPSFDGERVVAVPDCWSRRDPSLADFRGPSWYGRTVKTCAPFARLLLDSVDYVARVHVDSALVAVHEGGFTPVSVELPGATTTQVAVCVDDPLETTLFGPMPLPLPKRKIKGVQEWHDSRPGGIGAGPGFDSMWSRRWGTGGMTGNAWIHESGAVRVEAFFVTAGSTELMLSWVLRNLGAPLAAELVASIEDGGSLRCQAQLPAGPSRVTVRLDVEGAQPWRPESPRLYAARAGVLLGGEVSDTLDARFGFRTVQMETAGVGAYHLHLDGEPIYMRAANWIGGVWPPELDAATIAQDVRLAREANLNALGVHAGVSPTLAAEADRQGLLVFQDFPLQWGYDPAGPPLFDGGPGFADASMLLAAEMVYLLYNHPSIVYWCGHNEPAYQLRESAGAADTPELAQLMESMSGCPDESALDERRAQLLTRIDPTRPSFPASGLGASRDRGDVHDYAGSISGGSATDSRAGATAFVSEYGVWTANFSAAARTARCDWPPPRGVHRLWHEQTHLPALQDSYAGRPDRFEDFASWCFAGQLWAGWHAKVVTEAARIRMWRPSGGQRWHFLVDHFGDGGAGVLDRHRAPGPGYRGLRSANRPLAALAPFPPHGRVEPHADLVLPISVVSDLRERRRDVRIRWRLVMLEGDDCFLIGRDDPNEVTVVTGSSPADHCAVVPRRQGTALVEGEAVVDAAARSAEEVAEVRWKAENTGSYALLLETNGVFGWTSFVVQTAAWSPQPGLVGPTRFRVDSEIGGPLRDRWTGIEADPASVPPGQYLVGTLPVDVFDDVHVDARGVVTTSPLPW